MARYSAGATSTNAGTSARAIGAVYAAAGSGFAIRQIELFNTTDTTCAFRIARLTTQGTVGTALGEEKHNPNSPNAAATAFNSHSADATVSADSLGRAQLGAAKGSGIVWTFGDTGLVVLAGTANGIGIIPIGTGQVCEFVFTWDE